MRTLLMCTWGTNYKDGKFHYCKGLDVIRLTTLLVFCLWARADWKDPPLCEEYPSSRMTKKPELRDCGLTTSIHHIILLGYWRWKVCKETSARRLKKRVGSILYPVVAQIWFWLCALLGKQHFKERKKIAKRIWKAVMEIALIQGEQI